MSVWAQVRFLPRDSIGSFVPYVVLPAVLASVEAVNSVIEERAKELCPVDTGRLRDSITSKVEQTVTFIRGYVAPNTPYAGYVEFGTGIRGASSPGAGSGPYSPTWKGMPARPFMRPAVDEARDSILALMGSKISAAIGSPYK